jgi:arabinogalactan oligomer/maltooligosaccharide transport system permease protein
MTAVPQRTPLRASPGFRTKVRNRRLLVALSTVLIVLALLSTLIPIYFIVKTSFSPTGSTATNTLIPQGFSIENYTRLFDNPTLPFGVWFLNSLKISLSVTVITTFVVMMSAYAFSRLRFRGREALLQVIVLLQVFPNLLAIVAIFLIVQQLGQNVAPALGLNSQLAIVLVYVGGAIGGNVWLLKNYMDSIPKDIDESATIDGASNWIIFSRLLFPLIRPMLAVVAVLTFVNAYGEVLIIQVLIRDPQQFTLPLGLYTMSTSQFTVDFGLFSAGAIIAALPPLILFYVLQKWLIAGLTTGSVKS